MRTFLAFTMSSSLKQSLADIRETLPALDAIRPVSTDCFHVTVCFLGDRSRSELEELDRHFMRALPTPGPFSLKVTGTGAFPNLDNPSVLWAGVECPTELVTFVDQVEDLAVEHGADRDERDYHPHVTLARVGDGPGSTEPLVRWVQEQEDTSPGTIEADRLTLFESELTDDGPTYHELKWWPL